MTDIAHPPYCAKAMTGGRDRCDCGIDEKNDRDRELAILRRMVLTFEEMNKHRGKVTAAGFIDDLNMYLGEWRKLRPEMKFNETWSPMAFKG